MRKVTQEAKNEESLGMALEAGEGKRLSRAEFQGLGEMPPELEWFANLDNPRTRRAYRIDVKEFTAFAGVMSPEEMRQVSRAHLIAWRKDLERRGLAPSSIRRKLAAGFSEALAWVFAEIWALGLLTGSPLGDGQV